MITAEYEKEFYSGAGINQDKEDRSGTVESLLKYLNAEQRACLVLRNMEGLSYREISKALNININTVRSRLRRSREKLLAFQKVRTA